MKIKNNVIRELKMRFPIYLCISLVVTIIFMSPSMASALTADKTVDLVNEFGNKIIKTAWVWLLIGGVILSTVWSVWKSDPGLFGKGMLATVGGSMGVAALMPS